MADFPKLIIDSNSFIYYEKSNHKLSINNNFFILTKNIECRRSFKKWITLLKSPYCHSFISGKKSLDDLCNIQISCNIPHDIIKDYYDLDKKLGYIPNFVKNGIEKINSYIEKNNVSTHSNQLINAVKKLNKLYD